MGGKLVFVAWIESFFILFASIATSNDLGALAGVVLAACTLVHMFAKGNRT